MLYSAFIKKTRACPFCAPTQRVFAKNARAYLTYSIAPYARYHLLAIPKRHVESLSDLNAAETRDIQAMLSAGIRVLSAKGIDDYTILARNGRASGKSVPHVHYHVIPKHRMGDLDREQQFRKVMGKAQVRKLAREVLAALRGPSRRKLGRKA
jgi:histidine triad (HIT) family protein